MAVTPLNESEYDARATAASKAAIGLWCVAGWVYAAMTWRLRWLPALLIFLPGIFVASLLAMAWFIPFWFTMRKATSGGHRWGLLVLATVLRLAGFVAPIVGAIVFVRALRDFGVP